MKKIIFTILILLCVCVCSCDGKIHYYHTDSSETESSAEESLIDVPDFVFGENGLYDSQNDIEYLLLEGVRAKSIGELYASDGTYSFYVIENEQSNYLLCTEDGRVFKNTLLDFNISLSDEDWNTYYPGLEKVSE